jgi:flagellar biosynthesis/type III secretory pathway M-ring protein FliF/YscJ
VNMPFEIEGVQEEKDLMEKAEKKEMWYTIGQYAFYAIVALIILLFVVKPLINLLKRPGKRLPAQQGGGGQDVYVKNEGSEALTAKREAALTTAIHDKGLVSSIIKEWVKETQ